MIIKILCDIFVQSVWIDRASFTHNGLVTIFTWVERGKLSEVLKYLQSTKTVVDPREGSGGSGRPL